MDKLVKYRDYDQANEKGEYARIFEEEYGILAGGIPLGAPDH